MENDDLFDWYLARLRKLAWVDDNQQKPTPLTLVQTDKQILQNLVSNMSETYTVRRDKFLALASDTDYSIVPLLLFSLLGLFVIILGFIL